MKTGFSTTAAKAQHCRPTLPAADEETASRETVGDHPLSLLKKSSARLCRSDHTPRSQYLTSDFPRYNGGITNGDQEPPPDSELGLAQVNHLIIESYILDSIDTHKSARYAIEHALSGFATDNAIASITNRNPIMFSERNSEALCAVDNDDYGAVEQDDYDTWGGEAQLVQWGSGKYGDQVGFVTTDTRRGQTTSTTTVTSNSAAGKRRGLNNILTSAFASHSPIRLNKTA
jgi:hypothetical protein